MLNKLLNLMVFFYQISNDFVNEIPWNEHFLIDDLSSLNIV